MSNIDKSSKKFKDESYMIEYETRILKRWKTLSFLQTLRLNGIIRMMIISCLIFFKYRIVNKMAVIISIKNEEDKPERWVKLTDFANAEAIGYLADRLASYGVEKELFKNGAKAGDEVRIGSGEEAVIFDWEPSIEAGAELLAGPRGEDLRLSTPWRMDLLNDDIDQLSDDEIEMQWEYNVANPKSPRVDEDVR